MTKLLQKAKAILDAMASAGVVITTVSLMWLLVSGQIRPEKRRDGENGAPVLARGEAEDVRGLRLKVLLPRRLIREDMPAKVAVLEFSDFECPYCGRYARDTFPAVKAAYIDTGKIVYDFRHLPLEAIHRSALIAAEYATCAGQQGRLWDVHRMFFEDQRRLSPNDIMERLQSLGLNGSALRSCLKNVLPDIRKDQAEAKRLGITSTPTFLIGEIEPAGTAILLRRISGAYPFETFQRAVGELLEPKERAAH